MKEQFTDRLENFGRLTRIQEVQAFSQSSVKKNILAESLRYVFGPIEKVREFPSDGYYIWLLSILSWTLFHFR